MSEECQAAKVTADFQPGCVVTPLIQKAEGRLLSVIHSHYFKKKKLLFFRNFGINGRETRHRIAGLIKLTLDFPVGCMSETWRDAPPPLSVPRVILRRRGRGWRCFNWNFTELKNEARFSPPLRMSPMESDSIREEIRSARCLRNHRSIDDAFNNL